MLPLLQTWLVAVDHTALSIFSSSLKILMNRAPEDQYEYLDAHPRHVMIPHRLMAYPNDVSFPLHCYQLSDCVGHGTTA
jgi:hypothetical protein